MIGTAAGLPLDFCLLGYFERVVHLDSKRTHRALKLDMPQQQLNGSQVLRAPVDVNFHANLTQRLCALNPGLSETWKLSSVGKQEVMTFFARNGYLRSRSLTSIT